MKTVITGPTGAIGMALIQKFIEEQIQVLAVCRRGSEGITNIQKLPGSRNYVKILQADLEEFEDLSRQIEEKYDVFYHLAWAGTTGTVRNDMYLQSQNIKYTLDAVNLAHHLCCSTFIGIGSQAEYGRVNEALTPEMPAFPENGYGMAKLCAGQMSRRLCEEIGMKHMWIRILSVYGPYENQSSMVSSSLQRLLNGEHVSFTGGEQIWDYLYSADAAEALYLLAGKGKNGKTYALGSGEGRLLKEYIEEMYAAVKETAGNKNNPKVGTIGIGEIPYSDKQVMHLEADISELTKDTGFVPQIPFHEGIKAVIQKLNCNK